MAAEFFDESRKLRDNLIRHADDALYVHQNNPISDPTDASELRETLMRSVMQMMEMEGDVEKNEKIYADLTATVKEAEELPTDDEMRKMWEDAEKKIGEFKGTNRKHFKDVIKTIRDEKNVEDDGEEMEVMQVQHSRKDPISKKDIVNPVINEVSCSNSDSSNSYCTRFPITHHFRPAVTSMIANLSSSSPEKRRRSSVRCKDAPRQSPSRSSLTTPTTGRTSSRNSDHLPSPMINSPPPLSQLTFSLWVSRIDLFHFPSLLTCVSVSCCFINIRAVVLVAEKTSCVVR